MDHFPPGGAAGILQDCLKSDYFYLRYSCEVDIYNKEYRMFWSDRWDGVFYESMPGDIELHAALSGNRLDSSALNLGEHIRVAYTPA